MVVRQGFTVVKSVARIVDYKICFANSWGGKEVQTLAGRFSQISGDGNWIESHMHELPTCKLPTLKEQSYSPEEN